MVVKRRWRVLLSSAVGALLLVPSTASAAREWHDGVAKYGYAINCPSQIFGNPYIEPDGAAWAGAYLDANDLPKAGQVFYIRIAAAGVGNPCAGMFANFELILPADVRLAISQDFPVICAYIRPGENDWTLEPNCPQQPGIGRFGMTFNPSQGAWPLPSGSMMQVQIPVYSRKPLVGAGGQALNCGDCFVAPVQIIDGNDNPYVDPYQWLNVNAAEPAAGFPNPFSEFNDTARTATTTAYEFNYFIAGEAVALLSEDVNGNGQLDSNEPVVGQTTLVPATANDYAVQMAHTWSNLKPNKRYFYELGFFPGGFASGSEALVAPPRAFVTPNWAPTASAVGVTGGGTATQAPPPSSQTQPPPSQPPAASDRSTNNSIDALKQGGGPTRPVPPAPKAADTTKPTGKVTVAASQRIRVLPKGLKARLTCSETVTATAMLTVDAKTAKGLKLKGKKGKPVTIGTGTGSCAPGPGTSITVKLRRDNARRIGKLRRRFKATLAVTLADGAGNKTVTAVKLTFKP
jgi:hypothetical protein